ncbi:MAG: hypothetical protein KDM91_14640 [Verrucomicrobiae bacterium]|nr:hypothetical protein [Verrucomicrobiae bacterium]MCB1236302.1 hypothetical protein [Verrucomicrobiae bacterium]MCP5541964.1 hypothetical protein [Akkermansiaceae bacterium]
MFKGLFSNQLGQIRYADWEWRIARLGFAVCVWFATWHTWKFWAIDIRDQYMMKGANGIPSLFDISWVGQPVPTAVLALLMAVLLVLYVLGRRLLPVTGGLFLIHAVVGGIFSSPVGDHHATQVVGLVLLGQFAWFVWDALRGTERRKMGLDAGSGAIFWSQQMICAGYMISAVSKWVNSGGGIIPGARWVAQLPNIAVQFEKNRLQAYYDHLEVPASKGINAMMTQMLIEKPALAMVFLSFGFYIELVAFLALFNRKASFWMGLGLMSLHGFIFFIMHLPFYYFWGVDFFFFVNLPFWIAVWRGKADANQGLAASAGA